MLGCTQGGWHPHDVWTHTLTALEALPDHARLEIRLGLLWHDVGKPVTRTADSGMDGSPVSIFTGIRQCRRGTCPNHDEPPEIRQRPEIRDVTTLVAKHMRLGEYRDHWTDASVKRLHSRLRARISMICLFSCAAICPRLRIPEGEGVDLARPAPPH